MEDIIIVGGGASGLTASIFCARNNKKVLILEHKDKAGKKILATGNGKCNYTNLYYDENCYRGENKSFIENVINQFDAKHTIKFFQQLGIYPKNKNGYMYPNSEQALSILDVLLMELKRLNVEILCNENVETIVKEKDKFIIETSNNKFISRNVVIATGGCASNKFGSDGSGYKFAKTFGHNIIQVTPALVALKSNKKFLKKLSGVRVTAEISLYVNNILTSKEFGEIQFTNYGISGIPTFQISRYATKALANKKDTYVILDFMPDINIRDLENLIKVRLKDNYYKTMYEFMIGLFNNKLSDVILSQAGINSDIKCNKFNNIKKLAEKIKLFKIDISGDNSFENAQVCAGGVDTRQIDVNSMQSKLVKGLYFIGEVLDVDGTCGGYNLQWAWSSAYVLGKSFK